MNPDSQHLVVNKVLTDDILRWYDRHARTLPWRISPADRMYGVAPDPYRVWLSEIMLQQTTIPHGARYFETFTELWPTVEALAAAPLEDVMTQWAGLGYYARARNLHKCANTVAERGGFPTQYEELINLPGIGPYTAGAIAAIAFDQPVAAVDGNVERVITRLFAIDTPLKTAKPQIKSITQTLVPTDRPGDFAQAMMDLGATVCTPKSPNCMICPVSGACEARKHATPERFPVKNAKADKPVRHGRCFFLHDGRRFLVERRPERGLLGGMLGLPTTDWRDISPTDEDASAARPAAARWTHIGDVRHVFTHFTLHLAVEIARTNSLPARGPLADIDSADQAGLPSVFLKAVKMAKAEL